MSATSAQGLYVDDRRAVSSLAVTVGGERPSPVSHAALGTDSEFLGSVRGLGSVTPDPVVEVRRHRELVDTGLRETVTVACRGASAVSSELVFRLTSDGAPISAIKSGLFDSPALVPAVTGDGGTFTAQWHDYRVSFEPAPTSVSVVDSAVVARFAVTVPPDGSFATTMSVTSARTAQIALRRRPRRGAGAVGRRAGRGHRPASSADRVRLAHRPARPTADGSPLPR